MPWLKWLQVGLFIVRVGLRIKKTYQSIKGLSMKKLVGFDKELGSDGAKVAGQLGVSGSNLTAQIEVTYPIEKVIEPALKVVDSLVDKLEKLIPGDQSAVAAKLKAEAREEIVELLSEKTQAPAVPV